MPRPLPPIPAKLSTIDDLNREQHYHLSSSDKCYFLWEWTPTPYALSATTNFIGNFQRETRFRGRDSWWYKEQAIAHAAIALARTVPTSWAKLATFVPVPPSKIKSDHRHDTRLMDTLRHVSAIADVRELVIQDINTEPRKKEVSPRERAANWRIDKGVTGLDPVSIVVFDDLLTGGSHFAGMKLILEREFPGVPVRGLFLARRVLLDLSGNSAL